MQFAVMRPAQRHREFVADLLPKSSGLREAQMVRVAGLSVADDAGLFRNEPQVLLVPKPLGLRQGQEALVDAIAGFVTRARRSLVEMPLGPFPHLPAPECLPWARPVA